MVSLSNVPSKRCDQNLMSIGIPYGGNNILSERKRRKEQFSRPIHPLNPPHTCLPLTIPSTNTPLQRTPTYQTAPTRYPYMLFPLHFCLPRLSPIPRPTLLDKYFPYNLLRALEGTCQHPHAPENYFLPRQ